ncbi:hypothetical protein [Amycolatopsis japonica]
MTLESGATPHHGTVLNPQKAQGSTSWLMNGPKTARRDAKVVDWWHIDPPPSGPPSALSEADRASMSEFADRLLRRKPAEGGVPWDIQLHVTETEYWSREYGKYWFELLESELKLALMGHGVPENSDLLKFDFDHLGHEVARTKGIPPGIDMLVYDTAGQMIHGYQNAPSLELLFLPFREDLVASSRRKLHWRVEGMVDGNGGDQSLLLLDLKTRGSLRDGRAKSAAQEIKKAASKAYRGTKSDEEIEKFIKTRTALIFGTSNKLQGLYVDLIQTPTGVSTSLRDASGVLAAQDDDVSVSNKVRKEWQSQLAKARAEARAKALEKVLEKSAEESRANASFEISEVRGTALWLLNGSGIFRRDDAEVVDWCHANPPKSGPLALLEEDKASMVEFAGRLLRRKPVEGGVPWDIQVHVTKHMGQSEKYDQKLFKLLMEELRAALLAHGVHENADLLNFDFDYIKHWEDKRKAIIPSVDIFVYDTAGQMIQDHQRARGLKLLFIPYRKELMASSRRKLHWSVDGLARIVDADKSDPSLLVLKLRSNKAAREGLTKLIIREIKAAAQKTHPEKSDEEVENFIKTRTKFIYLTSKNETALLVDLKRRDPGSASALTQERAGGDRSGGVQSQAREVPDDRGPLFSRAQEGSVADGREWPYVLPSGDLLSGPEEYESSRTLGFASPGVGEPVSLSDVVGGELELAEVGFVALTDGAGGEAGTLFPLDRG